MPEVVFIVSAISRAARTVTGGNAVTAAVALTIFCVILGSSSVHDLVGPGKKLRWVALFVLVAIACSAAYRERRATLDRALRLVLPLAAWFAAVALVSATWSVNPKLTFERGASFALLMLGAGALALAARARPELRERALDGILIATAFAAAVGLLMVVFDHGDAVQAGSILGGPRLRGLGMNPDTMAMLEGIALPIAFWRLLRARTLAAALWSFGIVLLLATSISASGSRGGLLAMLIGGLGVAASLRASWRARLSLSLSVVMAVAGAAAGTKLLPPLPLSSLQRPGAAPGSEPTLPSLPSVGQSVGGAEPAYTGRLADELYRVYPGARSLFHANGRLQTWFVAIEQGDSRPLLGFGFGTENDVFIDRVYDFQGDYVENSWIGLYLQLGAVGLISFVALVGAATVLALRRGEEGAPGPASVGVVTAGLALMFVQSYVYSVGNVATVAFWLSVFVAAAVARAPQAEARQVELARGALA